MLMLVFQERGTLPVESLLHTNTLQQHTITLMCSLLLGTGSNTDESLVEIVQQLKESVIVLCYAGQETSASKTGISMCTFILRSHQLSMQTPTHRYKLSLVVLGMEQGCLRLLEWQKAKLVEELQQAAAVDKQGVQVQIDLLVTKQKLVYFATESEMGVYPNEGRRSVERLSIWGATSDQKVVDFISIILKYILDWLKQVREHVLFMFVWGRGGGLGVLVWFLSLL